MAKGRVYATQLLDVFTGLKKVDEARYGKSKESPCYITLYLWVGDLELFEGLCDGVRPAAIKPISAVITAPVAAVVGAPSRTVPARHARSSRPPPNVRISNGWSRIPEKITIKSGIKRRARDTVRTVPPQPPPCTPIVMADVGNAWSKILAKIMIKSGIKKQVGDTPHTTARPS
ncbi:hypothetical protein C8F04DRAFT_1178342 [Mycena alexandri]|uniref:Uncharacterized protein n=1 Tax=Mycena alexandri TaxID=1745969 RepID=A0AAD6T6F9_9AGAR|nr:hypothetical protein C8F04DRAFT_1178342 [Mycena alexandri]